MSAQPESPSVVPRDVRTLVLLATAAGENGGPAAALPWQHTTLLGRFLELAADVGLPRVHVITRPGWEQACRTDVPGVEVTVEASADAGQDLARIAAVARESDDGFLLAHGEIVTQRQVLAALLTRPGMVTGALSTSGRYGGPFAFRLRPLRGRIVSAGSAFHAVAAPRTGFLGVLKVGAADRERLAATAVELAELMDGGPPESWERELEHKVEGWRLELARAVLRARRYAERQALLAEGRSPADLPPVPPEETAERRREVARQLPPAEEDELRRRIAAAREDVVALLLVGLVRSGIHVGQSFVRRFYWARPLSSGEVEEAAERIEEHDESEVLLGAAVKGSDGFFTTFFVSTWSRYVARWAARRGFRPNQVTVTALLIGVAAATCFAIGSRAGLVAGAVLLYLSFVADCVDGQLARYTRQLSKFGAWLDSVFDRAKEYLAFAGLAIGAASQEVWLLACAMLTLQTIRHSFDFSYGATDRQAISETPQPPVEQSPDAAVARQRMASRGTLEPRLGALKPQAPAPEEVDRPVSAKRPSLARRVLSLWHVLDRLPGLVWIKRMAAFPIGERFAVVCVTAALFTPRTTFIVLLAWAGFALVYTSSGRLLRSIVRWRTVTG